MKKFLLLIYLVSFLFTAAQDDEAQNSPVRWITIEQADSLFKIQPKPMLIDVYTDWCGWCKVMMKKTFSNKNLASYINQNFYPVRINAEKDDTLKYNGKTYIKTGKVNPLAAELLNGRLAYPTIVYIDRRRNHYPIPGYYDVKKIQPILVYFSENIVEFENLQDFINEYYFTYPNYYKEEIQKLTPAEKPDTSGNVNWQTFQNAINDKSKKLYLIFAYTHWCYSCKTMKNVTFRNHIIANYLNENFKNILFDLTSQETIIINGKTYKGNGENQPHQLAIALMKNLYYPSIIILDENFNELSVIPGYFNAKKLESIIKYFGSGQWKYKNYQEYMKTFVPQIK